LEYRHIEDWNPYEFAHAFYHYIWDQKEKSRSDLPYATSQRHTPCHNIRAKGNQIENSMLALVRILKEVRAVDPKSILDDPTYYVHRLNAHIWQPCPEGTVNPNDMEPSWGVYGGGSLTSQHFVGIGACLGILPSALLFSAEIGRGTQNWKFWVYRGFSDEYYLEQSGKFLDAIQSCLNIPRLQSEELSCRVAQFLSGSEGCFVDVFLPGCPLYYHNDLEDIVYKRDHMGRDEPIIAIIQNHDVSQLDSISGSFYWENCGK
jgi:hypothetical protein